MCVVSMVIDAAQKQWPPVNTWQYQPVVDMSEILKKLAEIDRKLGMKDCYDPKKEQFLQELRDRLEQLEQDVKDLKELVD